MFCGARICKCFAYGSRCKSYEVSADSSLPLLFQKIASKEMEEEEEEVILLKEFCITVLLCKYFPPSPDLFLSGSGCGSSAMCCHCCCHCGEVSSEHTYGAGPLGKSSTTHCFASQMDEVWRMCTSFSWEGDIFWCVQTHTKLEYLDALDMWVHRVL